MRTFGACGEVRWACGLMLRVRVNISSASLDNKLIYRAFSHDVMAAILASQNSEMAALLVYHIKPILWEFYTHFTVCCNMFAWLLSTSVKML